MGGLHTVWVFHIKGDHLKKKIKNNTDTGGFLWRDAHMCLLNQRVLLIEAGSGGGVHGEDWICPVPVFFFYKGTVAGKALSAPRVNVYHLNPRRIT